MSAASVCHSRIIWAEATIPQDATNGCQVSPKIARHRGSCVLMERRWCLSRHRWYIPQATCVRNAEADVRTWSNEEGNGWEWENRVDWKLILWFQRAFQILKFKRENVEVVNEERNEFQVTFSLSVYIFVILLSGGRFFFFIQSIFPISIQSSARSGRWSIQEHLRFLVFFFASFLCGLETLKLRLLYVYVQ